MNTRSRSWRYLSIRRERPSAAAGQNVASLQAHLSECAEVWLAAGALWDWFDREAGCYCCSALRTSNQQMDNSLRASEGVAMTTTWTLWWVKYGFVKKLTLGKALFSTFKFTTQKKQQKSQIKAAFRWTSTHRRFHSVYYDWGSQPFLRATFPNKWQKHRDMTKKMWRKK